MPNAFQVPLSLTSVRVSGQVVPVQRGHRDPATGEWVVDDGQRTNDAGVPLWRVPVVIDTPRDLTITAVIVPAKKAPTLSKNDEVTLTNPWVWVNGAINADAVTLAGSSAAGWGEDA